MFVSCLVLRAALAMVRQKGPVSVVSSAGADNRFDAEGIQQAIREAGFTPRLRNQLYELRPWPLDDTLR